MKKSKHEKNNDYLFLEKDSLSRICLLFPSRRKPRGFLFFCAQRPRLSSPFRLSKNNRDGRSHPYCFGAGDRTCFSAEKPRRENTSRCFQDPPFKSFHPIQKKQEMAKTISRFLVRVTGLEPAQPCDHKNLNLTRLPVPPHPHMISRTVLL